MGVLQLLPFATTKPAQVIVKLVEACALVLVVNSSEVGNRFAWINVAVRLVPMLWTIPELALTPVGTNAGEGANDWK